MAADASCPEPKPVTMALLVAAGAIATIGCGAARAGLEALPYFPPKVFGIWLVRGVSIGLATAIVVAISRRLRFRLLLSPVFAGIAAVAELICFSVVMNIAVIKDLDTLLFIIRWFLPEKWIFVLAMVLSHEVFLRYRDEVKLLGRFLLVPAVYLALAGLSACAIWLFGILNSGGRVKPFEFHELADAAVFGLAQYLAMLFAMTIDSRMRRGGREPAVTK